MVQRRKEWVKVWRDGAAHRDLSYIIEHLKGVNDASGAIDLYELGDFTAPSRGGEGVKNFFLHTLEFVRRLVAVQERAVEAISVALQMSELTQLSAPKEIGVNREMLKQMFRAAAAPNDSVTLLWKGVQELRHLFSEKVGRDAVLEVSSYRDRVREALIKQHSDFRCLDDTPQGKGFPVGDVWPEYLRVLHEDMSGLARETADACIQAALAGMRYRAYAEKLLPQPYVHQVARLMIGNELHRAGFWHDISVNAQDDNLLERYPAKGDSATCSYPQSPQIR